MWRWGEDGHLQAKEGGLGKVNPADTLILDFILRNYQKTNFCCLNYPVCSTLLKTLPNEYYKDTHHRIFLIAAQEKNISVQQWRHGSFHMPIYLYVLRRKGFTWFLFFCQILVLYFSKFPHFSRFLHCITFIIRKNRRQKEQLWRRLLI